MGHSSPLVENDQKPRFDSIPGFSTWEFNSQLKNPVSDIKVYHCNSSNPVHFNRIEFSNLKYKDSLSFNWLTFELLVLITKEKIIFVINFQYYLLFHFQCYVSAFSSTRAFTVRWWSCWSTTSDKSFTGTTEADSRRGPLKNSPEIF